MTELTYKIRPYLPEDIIEISELLSLLGYSVSPHEASVRLLHMTNDDSMTIVAESLNADTENLLLGMLTITCSVGLSRGKRARISNGVIREEYRHLGVGRSLVEFAKEFARSRECSAIELTSQFHRRDAHIFWEKLGFERVSYRFNLNL